MYIQFDIRCVSEFTEEKSNRGPNVYSVPSYILTIIYHLCKETMLFWEFNYAIFVAWILDASDLKFIMI